MKTYFQKAFRSTNVIVGVFCSFIIATVLLHAAQITFSSGDVISADDMNANFTELYNKVSSLESQTATLSSENDTLESTLSEVSSKADANEKNLSEIDSAVRVTDDAGVFLGYSTYQTFTSMLIKSPGGYIYRIKKDHKTILSDPPGEIHFTGENASGYAYYVSPFAIPGKTAILIDNNGTLELYKPISIGADGLAEKYEGASIPKDGRGRYVFSSKGGFDGVQNGEFLAGSASYIIEMEVTTFEETGIPESITPPLHFGSAQ